MIQRFSWSPEVKEMLLSHVNDLEEVNPTRYIAAWHSLAASNRGTVAHDGLVVIPRIFYENIWETKGKIWEHVACIVVFKP